MIARHELFARSDQIAAMKTAFANGNINRHSPMMTGIRIAADTQGSKYWCLTMWIITGAMRWPTIRMVSQGAASSERISDQASSHSAQLSTCFR